MLGVWYKEIYFLKLKMLSLVRLINDCVLIVVNYYGWKNVRWFMYKKNVRFYRIISLFF